MGYMVHFRDGAPSVYVEAEACESGHGMTSFYREATDHGEQEPIVSYATRRVAGYAPADGREGRRLRRLDWLIPLALGLLILAGLAQKAAGAVVRPAFPALRVAAGVGSWEQWAHRRGGRVYDLDVECWHASRYVFNCRDWYVLVDGNERLNVRGSYRGCTASSRIHAHTRKIVNGVEKPFVRVAWPARGKPWNPRKHGGVACAKRGLVAA